jgi:hypothetical protein
VEALQPAQTVLVRLDRDENIHASVQARLLQM